MPGYSQVPSPSSPIMPPMGNGGIASGSSASYRSGGTTGASSSHSGASSGAGRQRYGGSAAPFARGGGPAAVATGAAAAPGGYGSASGHSFSSEENAALLPNSSNMGAVPNGRGAPQSRGPQQRAAAGAATGTAPYSPYAESSSNSHTRSRSRSSYAGSEAASRYAMGPQTYFAAAKEPEPDDYLHQPDGKGDKNHGISFGGCLNIATLAFLSLALLMLFAGYPILSHFTAGQDLLSKFGLGPGGTNGTGQIPQLATRNLVDTDTPKDAQSWTSADGGKYDLVFSDEFEQDGRTFWPGDDPFFTAVDIWYGATGDLEWYSPDMVNTTGGALTITMEANVNHNLYFRSGMVQSWNQFCFQGGYIEFSLLQPGTPTTRGYWPAAWIMGNLGRPGYLATTDGMWPYSYHGCDTGILPGQTFLTGTGPREAIMSNAPYAEDGILSKLTGMRSSSCTCAGEDHPGPNNKVARSAPEIDAIEAQIQTRGGTSHSFASQSLQVAPYDIEYYFKNDSANQYKIYNDDITQVNTYHGGVYQEAVSAVTQTPDDNFPTTGNRYVRYGIEVVPDFNLKGGGFVRWYVDGKASWEVQGAALPPVKAMDIGQRDIPVEPMAIVMNLGMSKGFQSIDFDPDTGINLPAQMKWDYVRVYQPHGQTPKVSCDPPDYPTADYINRHADLYNNPNMTRYNKPWPKNKMTANC